MPAQLKPHIVSVEDAALLLTKGQIVAYPTESVWGLGCDPFNPQAIERLLTLKQRSVDKGLIVICSDLATLAPLLDPLPSPIQDTLQASWQSDQPPTTWLVPHLNYFSTWVTGSHSTVAIRLTHHPIAHALCQAFGGSVLSTSANRAQQPPAKTLEDAFDVFGLDVAYVAGDVGDNDNPSRVIDALSQHTVRP